MNAEYLKESVGKYLCRALCEVAKRRPERPIEFLAYYLISLYEKDLQMQREEKKAELQDEEEPAEDLIAPTIAHMFRERMSVSMPREATDLTSTASSPVIQINDEDAKSEEERESSSSDACKSGSDDEVSFDRDKNEGKEEPLNVEAIILPPRKFSTMDEPVTEEESKVFGTSDPFLARRVSNVFDVNAAPIGNQ